MTWELAAIVYSARIQLNDMVNEMSLILANRYDEYISFSEDGYKVYSELHRCKVLLKTSCNIVFLISLFKANVLIQSISEYITYMHNMTRLITQIIPVTRFLFYPILD